jgi:Tol biopolymer transport system component
MTYEGENHMARRTLYLPVMVAAAVACAVAILAISQKSEAAFPGKNGRIAFEGYRDTGTGGSSAEIITVSPDGTGMKQLTSASGSGNPTFSPDGEKIAYAASYGAGTRGIYVMNRYGNAKKALTNSNNLPENAEIFKKNADGSGRSKNVSNDPKYNSSPDWAPKVTTATG